MRKRVYEKLNETVFEDVLPNGLKLSVSRKPGFARAYAVFAVRYGGADRRFRLDGPWLDTPAGIAHFLEHKMFDMPDGSNALSTLSAAGAAPNAYTSGDKTAYHFSCTRQFTDNLRTLLSYVSTPYFTAESVAKEQGIIGQEICMTEDNPGCAAFQALMRALYARHPGREPVIGTAESIARITPELLYDCHRAFYRPSNMVLCCSGDIDPEAVRALAAELLPDGAGGAPERDYGGEEPPLPAALYTEKTMEVSAPQFLMGVKLPPLRQGRERLRQTILEELALDYLAGSSSPYYTSLYADGVLTGDFSAEVYESAGAGTLLLGGESREYERARDALLAEIKKLREKGPDTARFERCRRAYFGAALSALDSVEAVADMQMEAAFGGWEAMELFRLYEEISGGEIADFLTETFLPERLALSVILPC